MLLKNFLFLFQKCSLILIVNLKSIKMTNKTNLPGYTASIVFKDKRTFYISSFRSNYLNSCNVESKASRVEPSRDQSPLEDQCTGASCASQDGKSAFCCCEPGNRCETTWTSCVCKDAHGLPAYETSIPDSFRNNSLSGKLRSM